MYAIRSYYVIKRYLLDNSHRVTLTLTPDPQQKEREEKLVAEKLKKIAQALSPRDKEEIVRKARELQLSQESEEDLSVLPTLELDDIPAQEKPVDFHSDSVKNIPVFS